MAVPVPGSTSGNIISEYAASNTSINRMVVTNSDGFLVGAFTANINYEKKDYVVDADGNKLGVVTKQEGPAMPPMPPMPGPDLTRGYIYLDQAAFAVYFGTVCAAGDILGEKVAGIIDGLILADLIARGILEA